MGPKVQSLSWNLGVRASDLQVERVRDSSSEGAELKHTDETDVVAVLETESHFKERTQHLKINFGIQKSNMCD